MTTLEQSAHEWENNAKSNALWAVLTDSDRKTQSWDVNDFFTTGRQEVGLILERLEQLGARPNSSGCFLDFGCGVGRVTRALASVFTYGYGIDVSPTMIAGPREFAAADKRPARYLVNTSNNLALIESGSIDFVYSHIVLQHVPGSCQAGFIAEFARVRRPGGIATFQLTTGTLEGLAGRQLRAAKRIAHKVAPAAGLMPLKRALGKDKTTASVSMEMNVLSAGHVRHILDANDCVVLDAPYTNSTDPNHRGQIRFLSEQEAVADFVERRTVSPYLSQFFLVRKRISITEERCVDARI